MLCAGGDHDVPERARVHPGGRQPRVRPLQPQALHRAEHPAARRAALALRPAVAHPGPAQPVRILTDVTLALQLHTVLERFTVIYMSWA